MVTLSKPSSAGGNCGSIASRVSAMARAITRLRYHFLFAGITYQGACPVETSEHKLTAEATGITYVLVSGFVDLAPFAGQRVAIAGTPIGGADHAPPALNSPG